jgi:hypothetical protein
MSFCTESSFLEKIFRIDTINNYLTEFGGKLFVPTAGSIVESVNGLNCDTDFIVFHSKIFAEERRGSPVNHLLLRIVLKTLQEGGFEIPTADVIIVIRTKLEYQA